MRDGEDVVIPLVEERVRVSKRDIETGRVRINTHVEHRLERVVTELDREQIEIRRVPVDRIVDVAPQVREEDGITIVPVVEEVLVVEKRLRVVEEIHLERRRTSHPVETEVQLARQTADVSRQDLPHPNDDQGVS